MTQASVLTNWTNEPYKAELRCSRLYPHIHLFSPLCGTYLLKTTRGGNYRIQTYADDASITEFRFRGTVAAPVGFITHACYLGSSSLTELNFHINSAIPTGIEPMFLPAMGSVLYQLDESTVHLTLTFTLSYAGKLETCLSYIVFLNEIIY